MAKNRELQLQTYLSPFDTISLEETAAVSLLNRIDSKFLLNFGTLQHLLAELSGAYSIVEIESKRVLPYRTAYYDTDDLLYYHHHHNGKLNRYKFRTREYVSSGTVFNEIKYKNNRGKTHKSRINRDSFSEHLDDEFKTFIEGSLQRTIEPLIPQLDVYYDRITLVDKSYSERMTIDLNLHFDSVTQAIPLDELVIVELKRDKSSKRSIGQEKLRRLRCKETGFSKYCFGIASTRDNIKKNNFKQKIRMVQRIIQPGGYRW